MSVCGTSQDSGHGNQATSASWLIPGKARQVPVGFTQTKAYVAETKCHTGGGESKPRTHQLMIEGKLFRLRDKSLHEGRYSSTHRGPFPGLSANRSHSALAGN